MTPGPCCATCRDWDQWLPGLGDCLGYVRRRRDAMLRDEDPRDWPDRCAHETEPHEVCGFHEEREGRP